MELYVGNTIPRLLSCLYQEDLEPLLNILINIRDDLESSCILTSSIDELINLFLNTSKVYTRELDHSCITLNENDDLTIYIDDNIWSPYGVDKTTNQMHAWLNLLSHIAEDIVDLQNRYAFSDNDTSIIVLKNVLVFLSCTKIAEASTEDSSAMDYIF